MLFVFLFIVLPLLEIATFIYVGGHIGVLNTLLLSLFMAILGGVIVRIQGFEMISRAQVSFAKGEVPSKELFDGLVIMLAAGLMITPGFVTDIIGFLLLIPAVRDFLREFLISQSLTNAGGININIREFSWRAGAGRRGRNSDVIDADYKTISVEDEAP